jgi:uncharacterized membrane protein (DUF106 family)
MNIENMSLIGLATAVGGIILCTVVGWILIKIYLSILQDFLIETIRQANVQHNMKMLNELQSIRWHLEQIYEEQRDNNRKSKQ